MSLPVTSNRNWTLVSLWTLVLSCRGNFNAWIMHWIMKPVEMICFALFTPQGNYLRLSNK